MEALPLLLSLFSLAIVSMDLALAIVWVRRTKPSWAWALLSFIASLLGAVVLFALDQYSFLVFTGTARRVLHYIWESILIADSAFILVLLFFFANWLIARPMSMAEKVVAFTLGAIYLVVSILWIVFDSSLFSVLQYISWTLAVIYCMAVMLRERKNVEEKAVRTVCLTLAIVSLTMLPIVITSILFRYMRMISIPIVCSAYTIAFLVFLFVAVARTESDGTGDEKESLTFETVSERYHITEREFEVIKLIKAGLTNKEIASELSISVNTVNNHIQNIFSKTEVRSRIDLLNLLEEASW